MSRSDTNETPRRGGPLGPSRSWSSGPSWGLSVVLHIVLIVVIALALRNGTRAGLPGERTAEVGIALKRQDGQSEMFIDQTEAGQSDAPTESTNAALSRAEALGDVAPASPDRMLPSMPDAIGPGALDIGKMGDATGATSSSTGRGEAGQGKARVSVFGAEGTGYKFVYVFDRSGSMGGSGAKALRAAKAELINSLESLERTHQFQIIFYNLEPVVYNLSGQPGQLVFGDDRTKRLARKYINSIEADGATRHEEALTMAIRMQPDAIFFLTDADEPRLSAGQIHDIARAAAGITINTIEFGTGPQQDQNTFLRRLAQATGGQYRYVNVWDLKTP